MVTNHVKLRRAANCAASPEGPQDRSRWSDTIAHARHAARTQCEKMVREHTSLTRSSSHRILFCRPALFGQLMGLFRETNAFAAPDDDGTGATGATDIDLDEQAAVYQAAYSKLAATGAPAGGVVAYAGDVHLHVAREFTWLLSAELDVRTLVGQADQTQVGPFLSCLGVSVEVYDGTIDCEMVAVKYIERSLQKQLMDRLQYVGQPQEYAQRLALLYL